MFKMQLLSGIICVTLLFVVFEAIRRGKLMEKYAILWIVSCVVLLFFSVFPKVLFFIARLLGTHYLTLMFSFSIFFIVSILLHVSMSLSKLADQNRNQVQEIAILKLRIEQLTGDNGNGKKTPA